VLALDRDWLAANYVPLHAMFPHPGYAQPVERDPAFQLAQRAVTLGFSAQGAELMARNPAMMRYMSRDAGSVILIKLIHLTAAGGAIEELSYTELGVRFGVSRTHVRMVLEDAERHGDLVLSGRGGHRVELKPSILRAFDGFLADAMSGHDLIYRLTLERMEGAGGEQGAGGPSPRSLAGVGGGVGIGRPPVWGGGCPSARTPSRAGPPPPPALPPPRGERERGRRAFLTQ